MSAIIVKSMARFLLPSSCLPPYTPASWGAVKQVLGCGEVTQLDRFILGQLAEHGVTDQVDAGPDYEAFLARNKAIAQTPSQWSIPAWGAAPVTEDTQHRIVQAALRMEELFPTGVLPPLQPEVVLTGEQVHCLLANMLLCTLQPCSHNKYWVSFQPWLTRDTSPSMAYLTCLLNYFSSSPTHTVTYRRVTCPDTRPDWRNSQDKLTRLEVICPSKIGDDPNEVEIDFANKDIGFGPGGTQEEIIFGMTPEACPAVLVCPTLQDTECLLISGVRRMGRAEGYGFTVKYAGEGDGLPRTILCMDALELGEEVSAQEQASGHLLTRELVKCYTGFWSVRGRVVGTGAWGCGAFGGDKDVKLAVQMLAASSAGVETLRYRTGDRELASRIVRVVDHWEKENFTVARLVKKLEEFSVSDTQEPFLNWCLKL